MPADANEDQSSVVSSVASDERWMREAICRASENSRNPFGAVIVNAAKNQQVSSGVNRSAQNPLWHGEIVAINQCAVAHSFRDWSGLTLYSTAEPCPMCLSAVLWSGIARVVYGTSIPTLARLGWNQPRLRAAELVRRFDWAACDLVGEVLEMDCDALFARAAAS